MLFPLEGVLRALFLCTSQKLNFLLSCLNPSSRGMVGEREYVVKGIMKRWLKAGTLASRCHRWMTGSPGASVKLGEALSFHTTNSLQ